MGEMALCVGHKLVFVCLCYGTVHVYIHPHVILSHVDRRVCLSRCTIITHELTYLLTRVRASLHTHIYTTSLPLPLPTKSPNHSKHARMYIHNLGSPARCRYLMYIHPPTGVPGEAREFTRGEGKARASRICPWHTYMVSGMYVVRINWYVCR